MNVQSYTNPPFLIHKSLSSRFSIFPVDAFGNSENNHKIALRRANAVIDALTSMFNIDSSRLSADSKGEDAPLANESVKVTETTADGQVISNNLTRMNRRVEFVIE